MGEVCLLPFGPGAQGQPGPVSDRVSSRGSRRRRKWSLDGPAEPLAGELQEERCPQGEMGAGGALGAGLALSSPLPLQGVPVLFMRSDGGLTPMEAFSGSRAILSGPAGGVVGYAVTTYGQEGGQPVIGFDMGGE